MKFFRAIYNFIFRITTWIYLILTVLSLTMLVSLYTQQEFASFMAAIENKLLDFRMTRRGKLPISDQVVIVGIDERSVEHLGRWPFKRKDMAIFLEKLKAANIKSIGFDAVFSEAERPYVSESRPALVAEYEKTVLRSNSKVGRKLFYEHLKVPPTNSLGDEAFRDAIATLENKVVMGWFYFLSRSEASELSTDFDEEVKKVESSAIEMITSPDGTTTEQIDGNRIHGIRANTKYLSTASKLNGFFSNRPDPDGIYRWAFLTAKYGDKFFPALSLTLAAHASNRIISLEIDQQGVTAIKLWDLDDERPPIIIPTDVKGHGRMLINYKGPEHTFKHYSLWDIYTGIVGKKELEGKILLLGATATGLADIRGTPYSETNPGVEIHATIVDNILMQSFLKRDKDIYIYELCLVLFVGLIFGLIIDRMKALTGALSVIIFSVGYFFVDDYFFFSRGTWTYMGIPYMEIISIYFSITIFKYFTEEKEKKKVRGAFQHYLNASVIENLLKNPDALQLGGEKKELTVFFSDVRGFTTISETLSPERLSRVLNEYFTPMTDIILKNDGLLDKYMGDAIMAVWGAPISTTDHAERAIKSSTEMFVVLHELQKKWEKEGVPPFEIGIGMNTGLMTVGNMGSDQRFDYTVMGDSVNLGSRLEGINKTYGSRIIISEFTYAQVQNRPKITKIIRPLDAVKVKGKNEPVSIFQVLEPAKYASVSDGIIEHFTNGYGLYQKQSWDAAIAEFEKCVSIFDGDGAAKLYIARCRDLKLNPPGDNWDGVFVFTTK